MQTTIDFLEKFLIISNVALHYPASNKNKTVQNIWFVYNYCLVSSIADIRNTCSYTRYVNSFLLTYMEITKTRCEQNNKRHSAIHTIAWKWTISPLRSAKKHPTLTSADKYYRPQAIYCTRIYFKCVYFLK